MGQTHLIGDGKPLRNIIESGELPNLIFYGPSGTGKTTLARMIAKKTDRALRRLNCTTAGTQDIKDIVSELNAFSAPNGILLYLDEIQYFNKKQQQTLLEYIENGSITLIASTTENPYFYVYSAILSRSSVFEFKYVTPKEAEKAVIRGFKFLEKEKNEEFLIEDGVTSHIAFACGGDVRKSLNAVELCVLSARPPKAGEKRLITLEMARALTQKSAMRYDREGDEHYDILSAFQKSMRGSDPDAALADIKNGKSGPIPRNLQNKHFDGDDAKVKGQFYLYPHDYENRWVYQQYLPDALRDRKYYEFGDNKQEQAAREYWQKIKKQRF